MKIKISQLTEGNRFQLPDGRWMTVIEVRPLELEKQGTLPTLGYAEIATEEDFVPTDPSHNFSAPVSLKVLVMECANHPLVASVERDLDNPKTALGAERGLCLECVEIAVKARNAKALRELFSTGIINVPMKAEALRNGRRDRI